MFQEDWPRRAYDQCLGVHPKECAEDAGEGILDTDKSGGVGSYCVDGPAADDVR